MLTYPIFFQVQQISDLGQPIGEARTLKCESPGEFTVGKSKDSDVQLDGASVSRQHLVLILGDDDVRVRDEDSTNGTFLNGTRVADAQVVPGDQIELPGWHLILMGAESDQADQAPKSDAVVLSRLITGASGEVAVPPPIDPYTELFGGKDEVDVEALTASGYPISEVKFCAVGGGLGSFVWVDHLRCYGVPTSHIAVVGTERKCYETYKRYCKNSQIPDHERLRSNSLSRPDNIWGFPGYALREVFKGQASGIKGVFKVFGEPALAESYTPRAGDVFDSLDREAKRIHWEAMFRQGQVRRLRKTSDGRYCIAYQPRDEAAGAERPKMALIIADVVHLSTGYPATRFVDDFQDFVANHPDKRPLVANAYEPHDQIYRTIEERQEPIFVVVRGRGIVASRILQRLSEARAKNPQIKIIHSMRSALSARDGATYGRAKRAVINNVEIQPFNWPKAAWGGDLRFEYEKADDVRRGEILSTLGGTSTALRSDWVAIAERGTEEDWYRVAFGSIKELDPVEGSADRIRVLIETPEKHREELFAHYLIDCTGLIADIRRSPFMADLLDTYDLPRNHAYSVRNGQTEKRGPTGLQVTNDFEISGLRNGKGRAYAAGTITTGGPYLAVDSFLGLQYSALRSVDHLVTDKTHKVRDLSPLRSLSQWLKWAVGSAP
jgi:pSer/pThr/pTyr-binding forkhead associated (FHA) protein